MLSEFDVTAIVADHKNMLAAMSPARRQDLANQISEDPGAGPMKEVGKLILKELKTTYQIVPDKPTKNNGMHKELKNRLGINPEDFI